ncbi:hypothetical protein ENBRE01_2092 [Enteropsectra breve]|nr:hypothetical protein ENBRE01_2092 [Enteropsectra breve]
MANSVKGYVKIHKLKQKVQQLVKKCKTCQLTKTYRMNYGRLQGQLSTTTPFKDISTDILGPIKTEHFSDQTEDSKFYILTITDRFSRWSQLFMLTTLNVARICKAFKTWIRLHGPPATCLSDQGRQFISREFKNLLKPYKIQSVNPQGTTVQLRNSFQTIQANVKQMRTL